MSVPRPVPAGKTIRVPTVDRTRQPDGTYITTTGEAFITVSETPEKYKEMLRNRPVPPNMLRRPPHYEQ